VLALKTQRQLRCPALSASASVCAEAKNSSVDSMRPNFDPRPPAVLAGGEEKRLPSAA